MIINQLPETNLLYVNMTMINISVWKKVLVLYIAISKTYKRPTTTSTLMFAGVELMARLI